MNPVDFRRKPAVDIARECYKQWMGAVTFEQDLVDYLRTGIVIARPDIFMLAKVIDIAPEGAPAKEPAWFVRMGVGDLRTLVVELPAYFPKIIFCRRNDRRGREYSFDRLMHLALRRR